MSSPLRIILRAALVALLAPALWAQEQSVAARPANLVAIPGDTQTVTVEYSTSTGDETLTGLGLRVHFDSSVLTSVALADVLGTGFVAAGDALPDDDDNDGDPRTDRVILVAWADLAGAWPGSPTARLFTLEITTPAGFSGTSTMNFTSSSTAAGYTLDAAPLRVSDQPLSPDFKRSDCNDDGSSNITDVVFTLGFLFVGEGEPGCRDACDSNDDGQVNISDPITTLNVLFVGEGEIPFPGMLECGADPTEDAATCEEYARCP